MSPHTNPRYLQGLAKLREIDGQAGEHVVASLADIAPDFARYLIEFPFGDIYSRPGLDLRSREIAVVAALTAHSEGASRRRFSNNNRICTVMCRSSSCPPTKPA